MHLEVYFIQSDLHCIQCIFIYIYIYILHHTVYTASHSIHHTPKVVTIYSVAVLIKQSNEVYILKFTVMQFIFKTLLI